MPKKLISALKAVLCLLIWPCLCLSQIDKTKYITIYEITPGADAVCLTVYKGVKIEKFPLKVVDIIRDFEPGRNAILVMGTDERFIHTGPVAGCSGSPVYINGRLAGATAFGWSYSKDPLYGVTPIEEMLEAGTYMPEQSQQDGIAPAQNFSSPVSLKTAYNELLSCRKNPSAGRNGLNYLPCPIATTLPQSSFSDFAEAFDSLGLIPVSGGSAGRLAEYADIPMQPGGIIALPLVYGDIELAAIGTITEVAGDKVYGFGHSFLGQGQIDVPMATGYVHTVVASVIRSFKFGQSIDIKGALYADQSSAIVGTIGRKAVTIPMHIKIERFDDSKTRTYDCQVISHRYFTPLMAATCIGGTTKMLGDLPTDHSIQYKTRIGIKGYAPIVLENFSSRVDIADYLADSIGALTLIMNNPYDRCRISSLDFEVKILPKTAISHIWSFDISDVTVKPGQTITAKTTIEAYLAGHKTYKTEIKIPENIPEGNYKIIAGGMDEYLQFATSAAPYKYTPENLPSLINIVNDIGNAQANNLYIVMITPPGGIAIENAELPQLPLSKAILLDSEKRSLPTTRTVQWIEEKIPVDTIVLDARELNITVKNKK
ncbi:MAG: SpoIVB peptidase S55 domain-containing protein [Phycisphaerae bacterium]|nr:SpoIVB peptidase S55 domain-containing protein [Phycisphaerae bacterium]